MGKKPSVSVVLQMQMSAPSSKDLDATSSPLNDPPHCPKPDLSPPGASRFPARCSAPRGTACDGTRSRCPCTACCERLDLRDTLEEDRTREPNNFGNRYFMLH